MENKNGTAVEPRHGGLVANSVTDGESPVLLLHGLGASGRAHFEETGLTAELGLRGIGSVVVDLPGHAGGGRAPRGAFSISDLIAELAEIMDRYGARELVGYSLGARLGWTLAGTRGARLAVLGGLSPTEPFQALDVDDVEQVLAGGVPRSRLAGMAAQLVSAPGLDGPTVLALTEALGKDPFDPAVDPPQCRTLLVAGSADPMVRGLEQLAAALPSGEYVEVPGDHEGAVRSPEFVRLVIDRIVEARLGQ